jgi:hypothetical protein
MENAKNIGSVLLVLIIIIIIYKWYTGNEKRRNRCLDEDDVPIFKSKNSDPLSDLDCTHPKGLCPEDVKARVTGLNEVEQNTKSRGIVPYANQPNHVANLWKGDHSHCSQEEAIDRNDEKSDAMPRRNKVMNMGRDQVSNMHIVSRWGCTSS